MVSEERLLPVTTDSERVHSIHSKLVSKKKVIENNKLAYYDKEKDRLEAERYYQGIDFSNSSAGALRHTLTRLLKETHSHQVRYDPSEYVYPWVDLRSDGKLKSVYSGRVRDAEEVIWEDHQVSLKRREQLLQIEELNNSSVEAIKEMMKYNCEHAVPQSWFNEQEPMRGDIHHLFTCEPVCNSIRSNYPYHDFHGYQGKEVNMQRIEKQCGKAENNFFEPEYAKGTVARAMLYFLLRYPGEMEARYRQKIDVGLLFKWHEAYPPDIYEFHRNRAIQEIQGNRNPYIDFPKKMIVLKRIEGC
ncbi:endonuclease I family protein [Thalassobacillus pellis]|uniref:endonuclease I family protein n=1 Tax=Thalassobacillus pellis TaxID=748008 RepID=UPI0019615486|nr:endonuclease [Thalassobacillus pellis]MBM7552106.1 endonuclease I [Thalassobacillus pellis]